MKLLKDEDKNKNGANKGGVSAFSLGLEGGVTDRTDKGALTTDRSATTQQTAQTHGAMGENLEYFIENRVIETLAAYALADQPPGFFKFLLGAIEDLISSVSKQTSILSHISVNASIR